MSTQAFKIINWLVDTWTATTFTTPVQIFDGPFTTDLSSEVALFVGFQPSNEKSEGDAARDSSDWELLGDPQNNRRESTVKIPCSFWDRRGGSSMRTRRNETEALMKQVESAIRSDGKFVGPPQMDDDRSYVIWVAIDEITIRQLQTKAPSGAAIAVNFTVCARCRS